MNIGPLNLLENDFEDYFYSGDILKINFKYFVKL